jgi:hypothetical protein
VKYFPLVALTTLLAGCGSSSIGESGALHFFSQDAEKRFGGQVLKHPDKEAIEVYCQKKSAGHFNC